MNLRQDPLTGELVVVAFGRGRRPQEFTEQPSVVRDEPCPFCPANEAATPRPRIGYPDDEGWLARAVPNKFPAIQPEFGRHLVLIESPRHVCCWTELTSEERTQTLIAYQDQWAESLRLGLPYAQIFKNSGPGAGASIEHSHSQVLATRHLPQRVGAEIQGCLGYERQHGTCFFCQLSNASKLMVVESEHFVCVCPEVSRFCYESWILPRDHEPDFSTERRLSELGDLLQQAVSALRHVLPGTSYNWFLHTAPAELETPYHWHLELFPRLTKLAGYELATGHYINEVEPTVAARQLAAGCRVPSELAPPKH